MDYLVATLDSKTGQQREVDSFVDKLKFDDRLFIFECDNVEIEQIPNRSFKKFLYSEDSQMHSIFLYDCIDFEISDISIFQLKSPLSIKSY